MELKMATVTKERDVRTHAHLWHTSRCLLERGQEQEKASFHQFMASLVFTAFALEAYLNWLGDKLFPHWHYLERLSPKEKLELLSDQVGITLDFGKRPWQIMKVLFGFRNDIAHGKPQTLTSETTEPINEQLDKKLGEFERTSWEKFCTRENAERARDDVAAILKTLHEAARLEDDSDPFFSGVQTHGAVFINQPPNSVSGN